MKERPILFSAPMVRAILEGRKTQTRRILRLPADAEQVKYWAPPQGRTQPGWADPGVNYWTARGNHIDPCPYGQPGDQLWVKETWRVGEDVGQGWSLISDQGDLHIIYEADGERDYRTFPDGYCWPKNAKMIHNSHGTPEHWISYGPIPSIFMPRWASRIQLEITNIRVERLQDISEADAVAEGCQAIPGHQWRTFAEADAGIPMHDHTAKDAYMALWDAINGEGSWDANPWVWVVEFKRIKP